MLKLISRLTFAAVMLVATNLVNHTAAQTPAPQPLEAWEIDPVGAAAETPRSPTASIDGAVEIALSSDLLTYYSATSSVDGSDERDQSAVSWGIGEPTFELGYGLSDRIVLGARLGLFGSSSDEQDASDSSFSIFQIGPKLEFMFPGESRYVPFLAFNAAVRAYSSESGDSSWSTTTFRFGAAVGFRMIAFEGVSIDPMFFLTGFVGSEDSTVSSSIGGIGASADYDADLSGLELGFRIRMSVWFK